MALSDKPQTGVASGIERFAEGDAGTSRAQNPHTTQTEKMPENPAQTHTSKHRKLRRKQPVPKPYKKYGWIAGHCLTIFFGLVYDLYYFTFNSHVNWIPHATYRIAFLGVWASYSISILTRFGGSTIPSTFALLSTENYQYLLLSVAWFVNRSSAFKLLNYQIISLLQLSQMFKVKPILQLEQAFKKVIVVNELFLFLLLLTDTLLMRGASGFGLVIFGLFYWLKILYNPSSRALVFSILLRLDGVVSKQKNERVRKAWAQVMQFLREKESFNKKYRVEHNEEESEFLKKSSSVHPKKSEPQVERKTSRDHPHLGKINDTINNKGKHAFNALKKPF